MNMGEMFAKLKNNELDINTASEILKSKKSIKSNYMPIAIIGMSGRYPGASDLDKFWQNLHNGVDSVIEIPKSRWDNDIYYSEKNNSGKTNCKWMGMLDDIDKFDPLFFNISPAEAELMDPQQRLFLEEAYKAFEDAGYCAKKLSGVNCGVFLGLTSNEYSNLLAKTDQCYNDLSETHYSIASARIAYFLNLNGPAITIDTACSSSLVATHLACGMLQSKEIDMALAGGVTLYLDPHKYTALSHKGMLSPTGRCHAFDNSADGFVPGEGVGAIILKRLDDALSDGDQILAVIRGSGINQDGKTNGITAPSVKSQISLMKSVYKRCGITPGSIDYIETHGTGTKLGDPIELEALTNVYNEYFNETSSLPIGSVKTNIGHTSAAAGVAGIQKIILSMMNSEIVPSLHYKQGNELCGFEKSIFYVNTKNKEWKNNKNYAKRAAISSFGFSGTNAHMILEEYTKESSLKNERIKKKNIFVLSAKNEEVLREYAKNIIDFIGKNNFDFEEFIYTFQLGRDEFKNRLAVVADNVNDIESALNDYLAKRENDRIFKSAEKKYKRENRVINDIENYTLEDLASFWAMGDSIAWEKLYAGKIINKLRVPVYPFLKRSYWFSNEKIATFDNEKNNYISEEIILNSNLYFIKNHIVKSKKTMPGAAYVNMIMKAYNASKEKICGHFSLNDVVYKRPIQFKDKDLCLKVSFYDNNRFDVKIEGIDYATGFVSVRDNLKEEKNFISSNDDIRIDNEDIYEKFEKAGITYIDQFKSLEYVILGNEKVYASINQPECLDDGEYVNSAILDCAFQAACLIDMNNNTLLVPYCIGKLTVYDHFTSKTNVYGEMKGSNTYDLWIYNETGNLCCKIEKLVLVPFEKEELGLVSYKFDHVQSNDTEYIDSDKHIVIIEQNNEDLFHKFVNSEDEIITYDVTADAADLYNMLTISIIEKIKMIDHSSKVMFSLFIPYTDNNYLCGIESLFKTASIENGSFNYNVIVYDDIESVAKKYSSLTRIKNKLILLNEEETTYRKINETDLKNISNGSPYKNGGVYLITGGNGGIGRQIQKDIIENTENAIIIVTGRGDNAGSKCTENNSNIFYKKCDITDQTSVKLLMSWIKFKFNKLDGVFHCAGMLNDSYIVNKDITKVIDVLKPKVNGLIILDNETKDFKLDFIYLFSSYAAVMGNYGQADYATANAFMDYFAQYRNMLVDKKERYGKTISINWPLWNVGMDIPEREKEFLKRNTGMCPMPIDIGMEFMHRALFSDHTNIGAIYGYIKKIRNTLFEKKSFKTEKNSNKVSFGVESVKKICIDLVSSILKIDRDEIDTECELNEYGFDSILFTQLSEALNEKFNTDLTPAIFFECPDIDSLSDNIYQSIDINNIELPENKSELQDKENQIQIYTVQNTDLYSENDFAIVGMSAEFPGAESIEKFWDNLLEGKDCITEIPLDRWNWKEYYGNPSKEENKTNIKFGGFINNYNKFDAKFFNLSPKEVIYMDPQHRLLLLHIWSAIEESGYNPKALAGLNIGVFTGINSSDYFGLMNENHVNLESASATGNTSSVGPNRISYMFDFHGPSEPVETACSSSLVALIRAMDSIKLGECNSAIVGGVNLILSPKLHICFNKSGMLNESGKCRTFDADANGYVRSEGVGALYIKRLSDAIKDNDHIHAVIKGYSINHGGKTQSLTSPNMNAQAELIYNAYKNADVDPADVSFIETHGTGTKIGDPVEINALRKAFKKLYDERENCNYAEKSCALSSVKTNIGHTEVAAGMAGMIKSILQMENHKLVRSIHFNELNPYINLNDCPFYINDVNKEWIPMKKPLISGISSFGFGGVNAHVVLEEYCDEKIINHETRENIFMISAKSKIALYNYIKLYHDYFKDRINFDNYLDSLEYTLFIGREHMEHRLSFAFRGIEELIAKLSRAINYEYGDDIYCGSVSKSKKDNNIFIYDDNLTLNYYAEKWVSGFNIDLSARWKGNNVKRLSLPTYPFELETYWFNYNNEKNISDVALIDSDLSHNGNRSFDLYLDESTYYLKDHVINKQMILPGAGYIGIAAEKYKELNPQNKGIRFSDVRWMKKISVDDYVKLKIEFIEENNGYNVKIYNVTFSKELCFSANIEAIKEIAQNETEIIEQYNYPRKYKGAELYSFFEKCMMEYGKTFRGIKELSCSKDAALAMIENKCDEIEKAETLFINPAILDNVFQTSVILCNSLDSYDSVYLPFSADEIIVYGSLNSSVYASVDLVNEYNDAYKMNIKVYDKDGCVIAKIRGFYIKKIKNEYTVEGLVKMIQNGLSYEQFEKIINEMRE